MMLQPYPKSQFLRANALMSYVPHWLLTALFCPTRATQRGGVQGPAEGSPHGHQ